MDAHDRPRPMNRFELGEILDDVRYKNWTYRVTEKGDGWNFQWVFMAPCSLTGKVEEQRSRKWYVSPWAAKSEVVRTVYKAIIAAEMHEIDENFFYKGAAIYDPHRDVEALVHASTYQDVRAPLAKPENWVQR